MTIDITIGTLSTATGIFVAVGKVVHSLFNHALEKRDDKLIELEGAFRVARDTERTLFGKLDAVQKDLQDYKLHVAETYIGEAKIEKFFAPLLERLSRIEDDIRRERVRVPA